MQPIWLVLVNAWDSRVLRHVTYYGNNENVVGPKSLYRTCIKMLDELLGILYTHLVR